MTPTHPGTELEHPPRDSGASESPEQDTYRLLIRTASRLEAELNRVFRPYDLTGATYNILRVLERAGGEGRSCGDIAQQLIAEVPDMTRLLDRLERLGYVVRERSRVDRRMVKVSVTEKGLEAVRALEEPVRDCHRRQLGHIKPERLEQLRQSLSEIRPEEVIEPSPGIGDEREVGAPRGH
jgi:DNA-binding MarR family transcriptional regulator